MNAPRERHYIHGDQLEGDPSLFYCSACDSFWHEDHFFNQEDKCCNHWDKYDSAMKMLGNSPKRHHGFGRTINSVNVFTLKG
jgi:hypothetical protein